MKSGLAAAIAAVPIVLAACSDDPTGPEVFATADLITELAVTPHHFHTWETTGEFTVSVVDPNGNAVTDFEEIRVERRREGAPDWGTIALEQEGDFYVGMHVFDTPANYDVRVTGMRESDDEMVVLYEATEPIEVVRAHRTAGGYTVSFEVIPGHVHAHDTAVLRFWFEAAGAHVGPAQSPPQSAPTILVGDDGALGSHTATESEPGVWSASHTFAAAADPLLVGIRYTGTDGAQHTYMIPIKVAEAH